MNLDPVVQLPHLSLVELSEMGAAVRTRIAMWKMVVAGMADFDDPDFAHERLAVLESLLVAIEEASYEGLAYAALRQPLEGFTDKLSG